MTVSHELLQKGLSQTLMRSDFPGLGRRYEGKVRDNYSTADGKRIVVTTDRISAFDRVLGTLPFKGQVLNQAAAWWFRQSAAVAPNHMLAMPDPSVMVCVECEPLPVEAVMRAYLTGVSSTSVLTAYLKGAREFCGHRLPDGLRKHEKLPQPILTPSTKAAKGDHDESVSRAQLVASGTISAKEFDEMAELAMALFSFGQKVCAARGLILVDTKYEFGKTPDGRIVLIDEIHTPDSSRFWLADSYESQMSKGEDPVSFDKEYLRRWLVQQGFKGDGPIPNIPDEIRIEAARRYIEACDTVSGSSFVPNLEPPLERIAKNLGYDPHPGCCHCH
jgi:phosphoribosylaminoimidazole-succinocarboxamide synthase